MHNNFYTVVPPLKPIHRQNLVLNEIMKLIKTGKIDYVRSSDATADQEHLHINGEDHPYDVCILATGYHQSSLFTAENDTSHVQKYYPRRQAYALALRPLLTG